MTINNHCRTMDDPKRPRPTWQRVTIWLACIGLAGVLTDSALEWHSRVVDWDRLTVYIATEAGTLTHPVAYEDLYRALKNSCD